MISRYRGRLRRASSARAASLDGSTAWSTRAIGNLHRPMLSRRHRLDASGAAVAADGGVERVQRRLPARPRPEPAPRRGCGRDAPRPAAAGLSVATNGVQIFPGGVPIYRVGRARRGDRRLGRRRRPGRHGGVPRAVESRGHCGNAPAAMRADQRSPQGHALRYVQCPQSPFNGSTEQNVCAGL